MTLNRIPLYTLLVLATLMAATSAVAQMIQGTDADSTGAIADPANWTAVPLDPALGTTVTFKLNPCERILYFDSDGMPLSCLPREIDCTTLDEMDGMLEDALNIWNGVSDDALTLTYGGLVGQCESGCKVDIWEDDSTFVVTRTYRDGTTLDPNDCPDAATPAQEVGGALRMYYDDPSDNETRYITDCDIVFFETKWDNTESDCTDSQNEPFCANAWKAALAHEVGHCLGIGHSYMTRKSLDPLASALGIEVAGGEPAMMSYDRIGNGGIGAAGTVNTWDRGVYLENYGDPPDFEDNYFSVTGTITDCDTSEEVFGAGVFALDADGQELVPVSLSITGVPPLSGGDFKLAHLSRVPSSWELLVVDARNANQLLAHGWDFDDSAGSTPGKFVFLTDELADEPASDPYKFETSAVFENGFDYAQHGPFSTPATGNDYDAGTICVDFDD